MDTGRDRNKLGHLINGSCGRACAIPFLLDEVPVICDLLKGKATSQCKCERI